MGNSRVFDEVDVSSLKLWSSPMWERDRAYAVLRRERPVSWQRPIESGAERADGDGYWAAVHPRWCGGGASASGRIFLGARGDVLGEACQLVDGGYLEYSTSRSLPAGVGHDRGPHRCGAKR